MGATRLHCLGFIAEADELMKKHGTFGLRARVYVSALTYCTTMTTGPSGLSVTVYQMVKPSDGRWRR
jgi:hypothetical protein